MRRYSPKKGMLTGWQVGLNNPNLYVAIPDTYFKGDGLVEVEFEGEKQTVNILNPVMEREFSDRFKSGGKYKLFYFLWRKVDN